MQNEQISTLRRSSGSGNTAHTAMTKANRCATAIEMALAATPATAVFSQRLGREPASPVVRLNYSVAEACTALGCGRSKLYDLIKTRQITPVKLGRRTLIPIALLESFVRCLGTSQSNLAQGGEE